MPGTDLPRGVDGCYGAARLAKEGPDALWHLDIGGVSHVKTSAFRVYFSWSDSAYDRPPDSCGSIKRNRPRATAGGAEWVSQPDYPPRTIRLAQLRLRSNFHFPAGAGRGCVRRPTSASGVIRDGSKGDLGT